MKHCVIALFLALVSCAKEPTEHYAAYTASCFFCSVEASDDGGRIFRDTINGHINEAGDTIPKTWKVNFLAADGDAVSVRACSLLPDSVRSPIVVNVMNNWVGGIALYTSESVRCAEVNSSFHQ